MDEQTNGLGWVRKANYGGGIFRRRILLVREADWVDAALEDDHHAFRIRLLHQSGFVRQVEGQGVRYPATTCAEAPQQLQAFVGKPLVASRQVFRGYGDPRMNCTHLHDLLWLAMSHALREAPLRQYDVTVPDLRNGLTEALLHTDSQPVLCWVTDLQEIHAPASMAGSTIYSGFGRRAASVYEGEMLEAAHVLQMGIFVANGRLYDSAAMVGMPVAPIRSQIGACYTFQPEISARSARPVDNVRDFTDTPWQLLEFFRQEESGAAQRMRRQG